MSWCQDDELFAALKNDPFHTPSFGSGVETLPPEELEWSDPEISAVVDELLDVPVEVEVFPSEETLQLVITAEQWLEAARATESLLGAPSPIDVERIEDIRAQYDRAPKCFAPEARIVRMLVTAIDTLEREHMTRLVELNRTVLRLEKQLGK